MPPVSEKKDLLEKLKTCRNEYYQAKRMFTTQYDVLLQYFYQTQRNVSTLGMNQIFEGEFLNDGSITDNFGAYCADQLCSAIMGYIWKGEKGTVKIINSRNIDLGDEEKKYFTRISNDFSSYLENKRSRFETSLLVCVLESIILGTTGMAAQRGTYSNPLRYQQRSVLNFALGYDEDGNVDTICFDRYDFARQIVEKYGISKCPSTVKQAYQSNDVKTRFVVTEMITPRKPAERKASAGKLAMPWAVYEFMPNDNAMLGEGGYESFPVPILFGTKLEYESYGRSFAMKALPTAVQCNVATEILAEGGEATARPPLGLYDNGSLAGKVLDLSGGALNVFNSVGSIPTEKPVFPLYTVGNLQVIYEWQKMLYEKLMQFFMLDKLFDFGQGQRMQNPEVGIRDAIRSDSISAVYVNTQNFMTEIFERSMDILFSMGLLGVRDPDDKSDPKVRELLKNGHVPFKIPPKILDAMKRGLDWYEFEFISPAARIMRTEALRASTTFVKLIGEAATILPQFRYVINAEGTAKKLREQLSADLVMINTPDVIQQLQQADAAAQAAVAKVQANTEQAKANQLNAQAQATQAGALKNLQETPQ